MPIVDILRPPFNGNSELYYRRIEKISDIPSIQDYENDLNNYRQYD